MSNQSLHLVEQQLLGMCLSDGAFFENPILRVVDLVSEGDFQTGDHQMIFSSIKYLYSAGDPITPVSVSVHLDEQRQLNRVGGREYIFDLYKVVVESSSAEFYANKIREASLKRGMCAIGKKLQQWSEDPDIGAADLMSLANNELSAVDMSCLSWEYKSANDLDKMDIPPVEWVVPSLIPSGLTILAGDAKIGKSFFAWNIALAVSMGGIALSEIEINHSRNVTFFALEDPERLVQQRLRMLSNQIPDNLFIINQSNVKLNGVGLKMLEEHIQKTKTELVIVDTWKHMCPDTDENGTSYDMDYSRLINIHNFTKVNNVAMILVTHTRKTADVGNVFNQIQGSTGMQAGCDTMLMLVNATGGHSLHVRGRDMIQDEYAMTLLNGGIWQIEGRADVVRKTQLRDQIIELLDSERDEGLRAVDIAASLGQDEATIRQTLRRMLGDGDISQPKKRGSYYPVDDMNKGITF